MKVTNLSKTYILKNSPPVQALKNVSFSLADSGMVFFLGKSGSGKSTLLNILSGLDKADDGSSIEISGKDICRLSINELDNYRNTCCGFVFQEYNLIPELNVEENIALAIQLQGQKDTADKIKDVLAQVGLDGYEKRKITELSGGQKQRIAIARALIKNPDIIFADEPTGALDKSTGESIMALLKQLSKEKLIIVVSHDRDYAATYGDRIIELEDGIIINDSNISSHRPSTDFVSHSDWKKSHLPTKPALKIGCGTFKSHPIRLITTILLAIIAFTIFCVSLTISMNRYNDIVFDAMRSNGLAYSEMHKCSKDSNTIPIKAHEKQSIDNNLGYKSIGVINYPMEYDIEIEQDLLNTYYSFLPNRICEISQEIIYGYDFTLYGQLPQNKNEIGITRYTAEVLNYIEFSEQSELNLIGKTLTINDNTYTITAIIDTKLNTSKYASLKNTDAEQSLISEFTYEINYSAHNLLFINNINDYKIDAIETEHTFCSLKFNESQILSVEKIAPYKNYANLFQLKETANGIYVPSFLIPTLLRYYDCSIEFNAANYVDYGSLFYALYVYETGDVYYNAEQIINVYKKYSDIYNLPNDFTCSYSDIKFRLQYDLTINGFHSLDEDSTILLDSYTYENIYQQISGDFDSLIVINNKSIKDYISQNSTFRITNYIINTADSTSDFISSIKRIAYIVFGVFAVFSICLLLNFLSQSLTDRTNTIGVLKANGCNNANLIKIFIWEGLIVGLIIIACISICIPIVCTVLNKLVGMQSLSFFRFNAYSYIITTVTVLFFSLLGCLIPLIKLSKLMPTDYLQNV